MENPSKEQKISYLQTNLKRMKMGISTRRCPICQQVFHKNEIIYKLPCACKDIFHKACFEALLERKLECPMCRGDLYQIVKDSKAMKS